MAAVRCFLDAMAPRSIAAAGRLSHEALNAFGSLRQSRIRSMTARTPTAFHAGSLSGADPPTPPSQDACFRPYQKRRPALSNRRSLAGARIWCLKESEMSVPEAPPLNGRRIAEFYTASEVAKRSVLRAYALPA